MPTQGKVGKFSCLDLHISGYNHLLACNNIDGFKTKLNKVRNSYQKNQKCITITKESGS